MKRSDFPAKVNADERFMAWLDGELPDYERAEFEAGLDAARSCGEAGLTRELAEEGRADACRLGDLLRRHSAGPVRGCDGLNSAILRRIRAETAASEPAPSQTAEAHSFRPLGRLVWGGFGGLAAAAVLFFAFVQPVLHQPGPPPEYYAQIFKATTSDPSISAVAVHSDQDQVTVLWIDGLDYVPAQKN